MDYDPPMQKKRGAPAADVHRFRERASRGKSSRPEVRSEQGKKDPTGRTWQGKDDRSCKREPSVDGFTLLLRLHWKEMKMTRIRNLTKKRKERREGEPSSAISGGEAHVLSCYHCPRGTRVKKKRQKGAPCWLDDLRGGRAFEVSRNGERWLWFRGKQ